MRILWSPLFALAALTLGPSLAFAQSAGFLDSFGSFGGGNGQFAFPAAVAYSASKDRIYVLDTAGRIQRLTPSGGFEALGAAQVMNSRGLALLDATGHLYIADSGNDRVQRFADTGAITFQSGWGTPGSGAGQFLSPVGAAVNQRGRVVYVADAINSRIQRFTDLGVYLGQWGSGGPGPNEFGQPFGIAVNQETGQVYVADSSQHRIKRFDSTGNFQLQWGGQGNGPGQFEGPNGLAIGPEGVVVVADTGNHRVQIFNRDGRFLFALGSLGAGISELNNPTGVALTPSGLGFIADLNNHRISRFQYTNPAPRVSVKGAPRRPVTGAKLSLRGLASDDGTVERVEVRIGKAPFRRAIGTTRWKFNGALRPGKNLVQIRSLDLGGKASALRKLKVTRS